MLFIVEPESGLKLLI